MWIEGIGDDVLFAIGAFFGMFAPIMIMVFQRYYDFILFSCMI